MKQKISRNHTLNRHSKGFTLVEVMLYLAITGLVIMIGLNAVGGRTGEVRFTDSMRSLQGFVTSVYTEFINGVKPSDIGCSYPDEAVNAPDIGPSVVSDGSCILFGKVILFEDETLGDATVAKVYNLVGRNMSEDKFGSAVSDCNSEDLRCLDATVIDLNSPKTNQILWGTKFIKGNERNHSLFGNGGDPRDLAGVNGTTDNVRGFGWLKEPITNNVIPIVFGSNVSSPQKFEASMLQDPEIYLSHTKAVFEAYTNPKVALGTEFNSAFCFEGANGQVAMLTLGEGESQEVVNLTFGQTTESHDCTI